MQISKTKIIEGKVRFCGVVDIPAVIEPIAEVRRFFHEELKKYDSYNMDFAETDPWSFIDAIQRHLNAIYKELNPFARDAESNLPHIDHILTTLMFLSMQNRVKK